MALEHQEVEALKKEVHSLRSKLGHKDKKIERMQKKIDDLRAVNQSYVRKNQDLYRKWRSAESRVRAQDDKIWAEIGSLSEIYEQRMAYLIDSYAADGRLYEQEVEHWAGDRAFAIVHDADEAGSFWKVVFQEEEKEDGEHIDQTVSGDDRNTAQV